MRAIWLSLLLLGGCAAPLAQSPALRDADVALLGETHDNPDHHRLQAEAVAAMGADALVFEMIPRRLEDAANAARSDLGALETALEWEARGWPDFAIYAPIFTAAPQARIYGAEVGRDALRLAMHKGLPDAGRAMELSPALALAREFDPEEKAALAAEIEAAHCGLMGSDTAARMTAAQRLRDATLADAALRARAHGATKVAVIAGNGHARLAPGAAQYLRRAAPELRVLSIGLLEQGQAPPGAFDLIRTTPARERADPCAALRARQS